MGGSAGEGVGEELGEWEGAGAESGEGLESARGAELSGEEVVWNEGVEPCRFSMAQGPR